MTFENKAIENVMTFENKAIEKNEVPIKVLLVDDEESMHCMARLALNSTEYSLVSAKNVNEARQVIASQCPPDIVITDAMMSGESGFSLITSMKSNPTTSKIPIILWTILEQVNGAVLDSSGKADITMSKPFNLPHIMESLMRAKQMMRPDLDILF